MNENTALSCHVLSKNSHDKSPFLDFHTMPNKMPSRQPNLIWLHFTMKPKIVKRFPIPALPWWCHSGPQRFSSPRATLGAHDLICSMWVSAMTSRRVFIYMYLFIYLFIYISTCYRDLPVKISATSETCTITINDCLKKMWYHSSNQIPRKINGNLFYNDLRLKRGMALNFNRLN